MKKSAKSSSAEINKAVKILDEGGIVIFPTDTVYGIGCKFTNKKAIKKLQQIKQSHQNFPVLVSSINQLKKFAVISKNTSRLASKYWPGGITLIIKTRDNLKVGFRIPNSPMLIELIKRLGAPIIATSANFHTKPTPKSQDDLDQELVKLADFTIYGDCTLGQESTVVDTTLSSPKILRQGAVTIV